jgi:predicted exporter
MMKIYQKMQKVLWSCDRRLLRRFFVWFVLSVLLILGCLKDFSGHSPINSNILDLIPATQSQAVVKAGVSRFSKRMGQQLIFLVGNPQQQAAIRAGDILDQKLNGHQDLFSHIDYQMSGAMQRAFAQFYFPYRLALLSSTDAELLQRGDQKAIVDHALQSVYSPIGIVNSDLLQKDPFFLFMHFIAHLPRPASELTLVDHHLMVHAKGMWYVLVRANVRDHGFSMAAQQRVLALLYQAKTAITQANPQSQLLHTGMLFYADAGVQSAKRDISTIGLGSMLGIVLLMVLTFRSLSPLLLTLFSILIGCVAAFTVTVLCFGSVYLFTLIFGASLIGIAVDYAFFYFAHQYCGGASWTAELGLKHIIVGISLGLLNVVLAYFILSFTPFPALKQLAVFAISGLGMSFLTVVCLFPLLLRAKVIKYDPPLLRCMRWYLRKFLQCSPKFVIGLVASVLVIGFFGISQLHSNDDIHRLQRLPLPLKKQEEKIKTIIGSHMGMNFYLVMGHTPTEVQDREHQLTQALTHDFPMETPAFMAINAYVPSVQSQRLYFQLQKQLIEKKLPGYFLKIGMSKQKASAVMKTLAAQTFQPITLADWLASPVSTPLRFLWLGKIDHQYASVVLLSSQLDEKQLKTLGKNIVGVHYINKAADVSMMFSQYRHSMSYLLLWVYVALWLFLSLRYGWRNACAYMLAPVCSSMLSLAVIGYLGIPLTLFSILGLILVLGIGVDYVLFFAETQSSYVTTMLAVSLSAITTTLSFGLLAFSQTPVVHDFGVLVLVGIGSAFLLSPIALRLQKGGGA